MDKVRFQVSKRAKKKAKQLRREGVVPANIYQANKESLAVQLAPLPFAKLYSQVGDTGLIYLRVEGEEKELPVLVDEVQYDSISNDLLHVVFRKVNLKEKIKANVPVELVGEFDLDEALVVLVKDEVEVEALPTDLPEKFTIDQAQLTEIGATVTLADLQFDREKVSLVLAEDEDPAEVTLVAVQQQRAEEVEEPVAEEVLEPERVGEEKPAEGEAAAETEASAKDKEKTE